MKTEIALVAVIAFVLAGTTAAFAQQKAQGISPKAPAFAAQMPKPTTPGGPSKLAGPPGAGPKSAPLPGLYHYRVHTTDQSGNAAAPKLVDDLAGGPRSAHRAD